MSKPFNGQGCFNFGKHRGEHLSKVMFKNPGYVQWCKDNISGFNRAAKLALAQEPRLELSKATHKGKGKKTTAKRSQRTPKPKKAATKTFQQRLIENIEQIGPDKNESIDHETAFNPDTAPW
jgi:hypothetical protein